MERKSKSGDKVSTDETSSSQEQEVKPVSSTTAETQSAQQQSNRTIKINPIYQSLVSMPNWDTLGIELIDNGTYLTFKRKNITIHSPYTEVLIFGAKTFYNMMAQLGQ